METLLWVCLWGYFQKGWAAEKRPFLNGVVMVGITPWVLEQKRERKLRPISLCFLTAHGMRLADSHSCHDLPVTMDCALMLWAWIHPYLFRLWPSSIFVTAIGRLIHWKNIGMVERWTPLTFIHSCSRLSWISSPQIMKWRLVISHERLIFSLACI